MHINTHANLVNLQFHQTLSTNPGCTPKQFCNGRNIYHLLRPLQLLCYVCYGIFQKMSGPLKENRIFYK